MENVHKAVFESEADWFRGFEKPVLGKVRVLSRNDVILESEFGSSGCRESFRRAAIKKGVKGTYKYCAVLEENCHPPYAELIKPDNDAFIGEYREKSADGKEKKKFYVVRLFDVLRIKKPPKSALAARKRDQITWSDLVLGKKLGHGKYSNVFEALQRISYKGQDYWLPCAVKIYHPKLEKTMKGSATIQQFIDRETDNMTLCNKYKGKHYPLIVELVGKLDSSQFKPFHGVKAGFVMKLEAPTTLSELLLKDQWEFGTIIVNVFCLMHSVHRMHSLNIQHRDLKSQNVVFRDVENTERLENRNSSSLLPILADLGLATGDQYADYRGACMHEAPEMKKEEGNNKSTLKADVYCLAQIIAQIVMIPDESWLSTSGEELQRTLEIPTRETVENSNCLLFSLFPGLKWILLKALRDEPEERLGIVSLLQFLTSPYLFFQGESSLQPNSSLVSYATFQKVLDNSRSQSFQTWKADLPEPYRQQVEKILLRLDRSRWRTQWKIIKQVEKSTRKTIEHYFPKLLHFSPLIARHRIANKSNASETGVIYSCLVAAADCLFIYALLNKYNVPELVQPDRRLSRRNSGRQMRVNIREYTDRIAQQLTGQRS